MLEEKDRIEIELSIDFGQRFVAYEKEILKAKLKRWDKNEKLDQNFQKDRDVILPLIRSLEEGTEVAPVKFYTKMMTEVGREFFKNEFKLLKNYLADFNL
jgi:hypothetical protein